MTDELKEAPKNEKKSPLIEETDENPGASGLTEFPWDFPKYAPFLLLLGPRGTGKNVLTDHLLKEMNKVYRSLCSPSSSLKSNQFPSLYLPTLGSATISFK